MHGAIVKAVKRIESRLAALPVLEPAAGSGCC
jgi:hypothetical protein